MMISAQLVKELREMTGAGMMDCKKALVETNGNLDDAVTWLREKGIAKAAKKVDRIAAEGVCAYAIDGNKAVVFEVNSETDFVAKNQQFKDLVASIGQALLTKTVASDEEALEIVYNGTKLADMLVSATATIGEKITLRRVKQLTKTDSQVFGAYSHMNGKIASFAILEGANEEVAKDVCMHVAAMSPKYLNVEAVDPETVAKETEIFRQEALNENAESAKPKPEAIIEKMVAGRVQKYLREICLENQQFVKNPDQTVEQYVSAAKGKILTYIRLEVGEGIEKRKDDFAAEVAAAL
ncbi:MAG: elongation factor Ts [Bacilli bacterium]|nr:elongation factor Ts [Bacilli bacterium]MBP5550653.1 elongation factor Ts [Bacilli bacterium]